MSWSFYATGKPKAVLAKADTEFERIAGYVAEPERSIAGQVHDTIKTALSAMPESSAVTIQSSGSQSALDDGRFANTVSLSIQPIYGFVE